METVCVGTAGLVRVPAVWWGSSSWPLPAGRRGAGAVVVVAAGKPSQQQYRSKNARVVPLVVGCGKKPTTTTTDNQNDNCIVCHICHKVPVAATVQAADRLD